MDELKSSGKPFDISKWEVWEAWRKVRSNRGAPGVDGCSVDDFEKDLKNNLYRIWNRMSSGSYFPPPIRAVEIPKAHGDGVRVLGVPTVADRVAQTVVSGRLEGKVEAIFHSDSYGYRPGRSALDAVEECRQRCWRWDWAVDLDIEKFFDSVPWDLLLKAVETHTDQEWVLLYVRRWLAAPMQHSDGSVHRRERGTPQGSSVSPVLANLFLHYAFDVWMEREHPGIAFERYVDDAVVHCATERQARKMVLAISERMIEVGLRLHPTKTKIVYCKDSNRRGQFTDTSFTFLGFTFRPRKSRSKAGVSFVRFLPAISKDALKKISRQVRSWRIHRRIGQTFAQLARVINPIVRGWMNYYGAFYRTELHGLLRRINAYLVRWIRRKYKRLAGLRKALACLKGIAFRYPRMFAHWQWTSLAW